MLDYSRRDGFFPPTSGRLQFPCQSSFESFHWLCCWLDLLLQALPLSLGIDFSEMLVVPNKLIAAADYMAYWTDSVNPNVWIVIYAIPPIIFNLFNVRRYNSGSPFRKQSHLFFLSPTAFSWPCKHLRLPRGLERIPTMKLSRVRLPPAIFLVLPPPGSIVRATKDTW